MGIRKSLGNKISNDKPPVAGTSNLGSKTTPNDPIDRNQLDGQTECFENKKSKRTARNSVARSSHEVYRRGMSMNVCRRQLFIQEGLIGFEELPLRNKMSEIINQSSEDCRIYIMSWASKINCPVIGMTLKSSWSIFVLVKAFMR